jgi:hypothetical protein
MTSKKVIKTSVGRHYGSIKNKKTFNEAYEHIRANPEHIYYSSGNATQFRGKAYIAKKGIHKGEKVITFSRIDSKQVSAYAYRDCWGKQTNCYGTYIDCYTQEI